MNARIQRVAGLATWLAAALWLAYWWNTSIVIGYVGLFAILTVQWSFLAIEFIVMRHINKADPTPQASLQQLGKAWLGENRVCAEVFCWRQPWRTHALPDAVPQVGAQGKRGVVFLHGFFCNRALWLPYTQALSAQGHPHIALTMEPAFGSIDDYTAQIDSAVTKMTAATGLPPLLVGHSMGGLAARAWLRAANADGRIHQVVTIGTPHHGTWLGNFSHTVNGGQMRPNSAWLKELAASETPQRLAKFVCWMSNCDNIVFPVSNAHLEYAQNLTDHGHGHVQLAFTPLVMQDTLRRILA